MDGVFENNHYSETCNIIQLHLRLRSHFEELTLLRICADTLNEIEWGAFVATACLPSSTKTTVELFGMVQRL